MSGKISGDGKYTKLCHRFLEEKYGFRKALLTTSCTDALELAALLINIQPGDEVIMPSYTFVSTANAFELRGAKIVFCDSYDWHPNMDADKVEELITDKTKAIVPVHYAGMACDMDRIMQLASKYNLYVVEDAAQAIDSTYKGKPLGSIGNLSAFSFHETKNIICGEGGMLAINSDNHIFRAEILREKGTNRSAFFRGEIDKYGWVDIGSSFLPSEINAAFLYAQLENLERIQARRKEIWWEYYEGLKPLEQKGFVQLPQVPEYATVNGHIFYMLTENEQERDALIAHLKDQDIGSVFHYQSLHASNYFKSKHDGRELINSDRYSQTLLRFPLFYELRADEVRFIMDKIYQFYA